MSALVTVVLGASPRPDRYSHMAVQRLLQYGHTVIPVAYRANTIGDLTILTEFPQGQEVHTVTMYLNAHNQEAWEDSILSASPKRIIFNPGAENDRLARKAEEAGIEVVEGCTLVMLSAGTY